MTHTNETPVQPPPVEPRPPSDLAIEVEPPEATLSESALDEWAKLLLAMADRRIAERQAGGGLK
jgi:hypothetical protein